MMEEVTIPHTSSAPPSVGEERIKICELDDIAQIAFKGTKFLNRIQTVVFDAAYHTNENLLISAPTGAGKTNIAMLTVLHEIQSNIEAGVIKLDKFKVRGLIQYSTLSISITQVGKGSPMSQPTTCCSVLCVGCIEVVLEVNCVSGVSVINSVWC